MKILVNLITTMRFGYTLFLPLLKTKVAKDVFIVNIIILFLTDTLDGFLARKFKVQSLFGSLMDTIADKALTIILLVLLLSELRMLTGVLVLEILISLVNCIGMIMRKAYEV
jgi:phosphatidylglycerophosphate synthase